MKGYCFVGDIVQSTKGTSERQIEVAKLLDKSREALNNTFEETFIIPLSISAGDSIQGVFKSERAAFLYGRLLNKLFYPEQVRFGIAYGSVLITSEDKDSNKTVGEGFVYAQRALANAKEGNLLYSLYGYNPKDDLYWILDQNAILKSKLSKTQREMDLVIELLYPFGVEGVKSDFEKKAILELIIYKRASKLWEIHNMSNKYIDNVISNYSDFENKEVIINEHDKTTQYHGLGKQLVYLFGAKQQTISDKLERSRIKNIRIYDAVILSKLRGGIL